VRIYALPEERREKIRLLVAGYGLMCLLDSKVAKEAKNVLMTTTADQPDPHYEVNCDQARSGT
jgi:hypothetical protein